MKLTEKIKGQPTGKGGTPHGDKQATQWAYYDRIMSKWKFVQPLTPSLIEKLCLVLTREKRGIPLKVWEETLDYMANYKELRTPFGFLRWELIKRLGK